jgi:DNA-binding HxlR family transcriptional regulator
MKCSSSAPGSPIEIACRILNRRWVLPVLEALHRGPLRFNELNKVFPRISTKSLGRVLRTLEQDGLVKRTVSSNHPPQVTYSLLKEDNLLRQSIELLSQWGAQKLKYTHMAPDPSKRPESAYNTKQPRKSRAAQKAANSRPSRPERKS